MVLQSWCLIHKYNQNTWFTSIYLILDQEEAHKRLQDLDQPKASGSEDAGIQFVVTDAQADE